MHRITLRLFLIITASRFCYGECPFQFIGTGARLILPLSTAHVDLQTKVKNVSDKAIRGTKFAMFWLDNVEDIHIIGVVEGPDFKLAQERKLGWSAQRAGLSFTALIVFPWKVLFEDGTKWEWTFETSQGCFGEHWRDSKRPRLTVLPMEAKDKILGQLQAVQQ